MKEVFYREVFPLKNKPCQEFLIVFSCKKNKTFQSHKNKGTIQQKKCEKYNVSLLYNMYLVSRREKKMWTAKFLLSVVTLES